MNNLENNQITELDINTRKELWDNLFLFVDFSRLKEDYPNMWNKNYRLLPLPKPYQETKQKFTEYCQKLNERLERLINSWTDYFNQEIIPILEGPTGDKELLFRCKRVLNNKIIGESSSLFLDLVIFEIEYRQQARFKEYLPRLRNIQFLEERINELWLSDLDKMAGRINYQVSWRFWNKWGGKIENRDLVEEVDDYLRLWQRGKGAGSEWRERLDEFKKGRDELFDLGSENISDGKPFLQLGFIKEDAESGLRVACQNRKGFNLNNPYLMVVHLHQRLVRVYVVEGYEMIDLRRLYVSVYLKEDWVWRDYGWVMNSMGSLRSGNHAFYHPRNLPENSNHKLHFSFCEELKNNISLAYPTIDPNTGKAINVTHPFPKLTLFKVDTNFASNLWNSFAGSNYVELESIKFVDDLVIKEVTEESFSDLMQGSYMAFIAPHDFLTATNKKKNTRNYYLDEIKGSLSFDENQGQTWFKEQPRLADHTTFQLFFLDGMLGTYNLSKMDYTIEQGKVIINYVLVIKATPSGIVFKFQSGEVAPPIRWNLAVKGSVITMRVFQAIFQQKDSLWKKIKNPLLKTAGGLAGGYFGGPGGAAAGSAAGSALAGDDDEKGSASVDLNKGIGEAMGLTSVKSGKATEEQHTSRLVEQVGKTSESISDPTLYYTNNIDYHFNFFDFWMRLGEWDRILSARLVFSGDLFNNLKHNNNANPTTYPLNITFEKLGNILRPGFYQGRLDLDYDPNGKMTECFARGATFYEDKKEHFVNPDLGLSQQHSTSVYSLGGFGDTYTAQAVGEGEQEAEIDRVKRSNYHQRAHFFIHYEDGTNEHWLVLFPQTFTDNDLADGHSHAGFTLEFSKPVKSFHDVYTCIGCGAKDQGYTSLNNGYDDGSNDSLGRINKGLPYEPWFGEFTRATLQGSQWITPGGKNMGADYDVWEQAEEKRQDGKSFKKAYGFIPQGGVIRWKLGGGFKIEWQKVPGQSDFENLDWNPPTGSGGETEIPLSDPEINVPEPGENDPTPDTNLPEPDPFDPTGGEPEIAPIEPDITIDTDAPEDDFGDIDPPPVEVEPPEIDPNDPDQGKDQDTGDYDVPPPDPFDYGDDND